MAEPYKLGENYESGLRRPKYINGRPLSAEDLQTDQDATSFDLATAGKGIGRGIVEGLTVTIDPVTERHLLVASGVGFNANGDPIRQRINRIRLAMESDDDSKPLLVERGARFTNCDYPETENGPTFLDTGLFLLIARPVSKEDGEIPLKTSRLDMCAARWTVEGIIFYAIQLPEFSGNRWLIQNQLAHWFFGSDKLVQQGRDPLGLHNYTGFDLVESLTDCDLPLATFAWDGIRINFVDHWSVRRRIMHPYPAGMAPALVSDQRTAEGEARFLQFQSQIDQIVNAPDWKREPAGHSHRPRITDYFKYLPPVGILPALPHRNVIARLGRELFRKFFEEISNRQIMKEFIGFTTLDLDREYANFGVDIETFLGNKIPLEIKTIHRSQIGPLLNRSWRELTVNLEESHELEMYVVIDEVMLYVAARLIAYVYSEDEAIGSESEPKILAELESVLGLSASDIQDAIDSIQSTGFYVIFARKYPEEKIIPLQNLPPSIELYPPIHLHLEVGESETIEFTISDPDDNLIGTTLNIDPSGVVDTTVSDDSTISVTGTDVGRALITVTARNDRGRTASKSFSVMVVPSTNMPPILEPIESITLQKGDIGIVEIIASDPDGDLLTINPISRNDSIAAASLHSAHSIAVAGVGIGQTVIDVTVSDGRGGITSKSFEVTVIPILAGLMLIKISTQYVAGDIDLPITVRAVDGRTISILDVEVTSGSGSPALNVLMVDDVRFRLKFDSDSIFAAAWDVTVKAQDIAGNEAETTFVVVKFR